VRLTDLIPQVPPFARVLYVDEFREVADTAATLLTLCGFDVRSAYDGPSALALAAAFDPQVCFLDLNIPGMDGDELAVLLHARKPPCAGGGHGHERAGGQRSALARGRFYFHLVKPAEPAALLAVLRCG
jgi:two-component system OmpR family response regulator